MRVLKFGGSSVATPESRRAVAEIVAREAEHGPVTVVCSALGGVTDLLVRAVEIAATGCATRQLLVDLKQRHLDGGPGWEVHRRLDERLGELDTTLRGITLLRECPPGARHRVLAGGERLALILVEEALRRRGLPAVAVDAAELLVARSAPGAGPVSAVLEDGESERRVQAYRASRPAGEILVVPGFFAADPNGGTVTLGRGASDLTATLLARYLDAEEAQIWTDVDGVLSAPPRLVPTARPLDHLSYAEAAGLARFGAKVLHPETLVPVAEKEIPVWIRNTFRPEAPGTRIDALGRAPGEPPGRSDRGVRAVSLAAAGGVTVRAEVGDESIELARRDGVAVLAALGGDEREMLRILTSESIEALHLGDARFPGVVEGEDGTAIAVVVVDGAAGPRAIRLLHDALVEGKVPVPTGGVS